MLKSVNISKKLNDYELLLVAKDVVNMHEILKKEFLDWEIEITVLAGRPDIVEKNKFIVSIMSAPENLLYGCGTNGTSQRDIYGKTINNLKFAMDDGHMHAFNNLYHHELLDDFYKKLCPKGLNDSMENPGGWFDYIFQIGFIGRNKELAFNHSGTHCV